MAQRQCIYFLNDSRGCFTSQLRRLGRTTRVLVRLLLVEDLFLLPAFMIKEYQFHRWVEPFIKKIRDQHMLLAVTNPLWVVERVADHSDDDPVAILLAVVVALVNLGQVQAV